MALNCNSIDEIFESNEYNGMLKKICKEIEDSIDSCQNEAAIIKLFEMTIYHHVRNLFNLSDKDVRPSGEVTHKDGHITQKFLGRMDSLYNNSFIIEYKHFKKLKTEQDIEKAIGQTVLYLTQMHEDYVKNHKEEDNVNCGILLDGKKVMFFYYYNEKLVKVPFRKISPVTLDLIVRRIVYKNKKPFIAQNIAEDFSVCRGNTSAKALAKVLFSTLISENVCPGTISVMNEWKVLFHLSETDAGQSNDIRKRREALTGIFGVEIVDNAMEYKALYALQTTYSIIVKLIAVKTLSYLIYEKEMVFFENLTTIYSSDDLRRLLSNIEDGYNVSLMNVKNLIEGDFFAWYCSKEQWNKEIFEAIYTVINNMEQYASIIYSNGESTVDIFRELYMEIMPNAVRHSLGEYYTPAWLADNVVENALNDVADDWVAVDPCCGSGVFVIRLLSKILPSEDELFDLSEDEKVHILNNALQRVQGVDINPISVLTARVNYFISILPLLKSIGDRVAVSIPIYLGDSANPVNFVELGGVKCNTSTIMVRDGDIIDICIPNSFVSSNHFYENMHKIQLASRIKNTEVLVNKFKECIDDADINEDVLAKIRELCTHVIDADNNGNAVNWLRIITNYLSVTNISGVTLLIGNPPWVKWEHLPQKYAEKIKKQCVKKHLFSGQCYMGAIQLNICALIADMTASHWLTPDGILAFLMPKTMLTQDSYAGFRNFYIDYDADERMYLYKIDDWTKAGDPFVYTTEKFATFYYSRKVVDYKKGVPVSYARKERGVPIDFINSKEIYSDVAKYFDWTEGIAVQLGKDRTGFTLLSNAGENDPILDVVGRCDYKARTGVEFTPSEVYWLKYNDYLSSSANAIFENIKLPKAIHKAVTNSVPFSIETRYVYPLALGPSIDKYSLNYKKEYCIFPYYMENGKCLLADVERLCDDSPILLEYLLKNNEVIDGQSERSKSIKRGNAPYALSKVGTYTFSNVTVAFRDNTCMAAVVLKPTETLWGEMKQYICAKHAPFITVDKNNNYITEEEGYYIAAILNTKVVERYFKCTYSGRSYSIKNMNIYMPKYDAEKEEHLMLAQLSKEAHTVSDNKHGLEEIMFKIETVYRKMCENKKNSIEWEE